MASAAERVCVRVVWYVSVIMHPCGLSTAQCGVFVVVHRWYLSCVQECHPVNVSSSFFWLSHLSLLPVSLRLSLLLSWMCVRAKCGDVVAGCSTPTSRCSSTRVSTRCACRSAQTRGWRMSSTCNISTSSEGSQPSVQYIDCTRMDHCFVSLFFSFFVSSVEIIRVFRSYRFFSSIW